MYPVPAGRADAKIRAYYEEALEQSKSRKPLIDVRSPGEFRGEITHMPEYPQEGVLRGGHVPCGKERSLEDGCPTMTELSNRSKTLGKFTSTTSGLTRLENTVVYCRIGERSSHTWFVLTNLLGFENVKNYDGSWTEWGNKVRAPIEKP